MSQKLNELAELLAQRDWRLALAESCTGGLIAAACTNLAGSSSWFEAGLVTYSIRSKIKLLGVDAQLIAEHGAVSHACARAMCVGVLKQCQCNIALSITGVAGPSGGTKETPVGTVYCGVATADGAHSKLYHFSGSRERVRAQAVVAAINDLSDFLR